MPSCYDLLSTALHILLFILQDKFYLYYVMVPNEFLNAADHKCQTHSSQNKTENDHDNDNPKL